MWSLVGGCKILRGKRLQADTLQAHMLSGLETHFSNKNARASNRLGLVTQLTPDARRSSLYWLILWELASPKSYRRGLSREIRTQYFGYTEHS